MEQLCPDRHRVLCTVTLPRGTRTAHGTVQLRPEWWCEHREPVQLDPPPCLHSHVTVHLVERVQDLTLTIYLRMGVQRLHQQRGP